MRITGIHHAGTTGRRRLFGAAVFAVAAALAAPGAAAAAPQPVREPAAAALARPAESAAAQRGIVHRPVAVRLTVDGRAVAGAEIRRFDGRALHFVAHPAAAGRPARLEAFTSRQRFQAQVRTIQGAAKARAGTAGTAGTAAPAVLTNTSWYHEHTQFGGKSLSLSRGFAYRDLARVTMSCTLFWCTSWNDQVSSSFAAGGGTTLYEHSYYGGSSLYLPPGYRAAQLGLWGWNDRASSLVSWS